MSLDGTSQPAIFVKKEDASMDVGLAELKAPHSLNQPPPKSLPMSPIEVLQPSTASSATTSKRLQDTIYYAEMEHRRSRAYLEHEYRDQLLRHEGQSDSQMAFGIPGDRTSHRLGMLADAARIGNRTNQYVAPLVSNVHQYFERATLSLLEEAVECKEQCEADSKAIEAADELIEDLKRGGV